MNGFITWLFNTIYGPQAADINRLAQTMYDAFIYEDQRITDVYNGAIDYESHLNQQEQSDIRMVLDVIGQTVSFLARIILVDIVNVYQYVDRRVNALNSSFSDQLAWFMNFVRLLVFGLRLLIDDMRTWVETAIAGPLWSALNAFITRATKDIWTLFQYILHPELLVKLIAGYLWSTWLHLLHIFAVPIARFVIRTMFALREEFVGILIDVLAEII